MKKIIIILSIALLVVLAACSRQEAPKPSDPTDTNASAEQTESQPAAPTEMTADQLRAMEALPAEAFMTETNETGVTIIGLQDAYRDTAYLIIPGEIDGNTVTMIGENAFSNNSSIIAAVLPDTVETVGRKAFALADHMEIFVSGANVKTLGEFLFLGCAKLKTVLLNDGLTTLEHSCLTQTDSLTEIEIPDSVVNADTPFIPTEEKTVIASADNVVYAWAVENGVAVKEK